MGKMIINGGGGGGIDPDELTGVPGDVLIGKKFGGVGSDEVQIGTMPSYGGTYWNRDMGVGLEPDNFYSFFPPGHYASFDSRGSLHRIPIAKVQGAIGATGNKIIPGQSICGVDGTVPSMGAQTINPSAAKQVVSCKGKYMTGDVVVNGGNIYQERYGNMNTSGSDYFTDIFGTQKKWSYVQYTVPFMNIRAVILFCGNTSGTFTYVTYPFLVVGNSDPAVGSQICYQYHRDSAGVILSNGTVKIPVYKAGQCTVFTIGY